MISHTPWPLRWHAFWRVAFAIAIVAGTPSQSAHGKSLEERFGIFGQDDRVAVDATRWPWQAIGLLQRKVGGDCSATLIEKDVVLTAGHCVFDQKSGRYLEAGEVRVLFAYRNGAFTKTSYGAGIIGVLDKDKLNNPNAHNMASDWAIVVLRKPVSIRPIPLQPLKKRSGKNLPKDQHLIVRAGWSEDRRGQLSADFTCKILHRDVVRGFFFTNCDTVKGDSGSPLLLEEGGVIRVVGVTSGIVTAANGRKGALIVDAQSILAKVSELRIPGTDDLVLGGDR